MSARHIISVDKGPIIHELGAEFRHSDDMGGAGIAIFDFCGTLASFQTADPFVWYVLEATGYDAGNAGCEKLRKRLVASKAIRAMELLSRLRINKKMILMQLAGIDEEVLRHCAQSYYSERVKPNLIPETIRELQRLQSRGYTIAVASGGYDLYLEHFCLEFGVDLLISTEIGFSDGVATGRYAGADCMGDAKVALIAEAFADHPMRLVDSVAYSDSRSDLPMLRYCRRGVVVGASMPGWAEKEGLGFLECRG